MPHIPFYRQQTAWTCGAACVRMVFASQGITKSEQAWAKELKTKKTESGTLHKQMVAVAEKYKRTYIVARNASIRDVQRLLKQGYGVIIGYFLVDHNCGHYAVVKNVNTKIHLLDPWYGSKHAYTIEQFKKIWHDGEGEKGWFIGMK